MVERIGSNVAEHPRDRTFHYPYPTTRYTPDPDQELAHVLEALAAEDANLVITQTDPLRVRFEFSDRAALMLSLQKHDPDEAKLREQLTQARDGGIAFAVRGRVVGGVPKRP
jgi:hypothetical protein